MGVSLIGFGLYWYVLFVKDVGVLVEGFGLYCIMINGVFGVVVDFDGFVWVFVVVIV